MHVKRILKTAALALLLAPTFLIVHDFLENPPSDQIECFQAVSANMGLYVPLGWDTLGDINRPNTIYICGAGPLKLTMPAKGVILNTPRFAGAEDYADEITNLRRDNKALSAHIDALINELDKLTQQPEIGGMQ